MFKVLILVCSINIASQDCEIKNAIHVIAGALVSNERDCGASGQDLIAGTAVALDEGEYAKI